MSGVDSLPKKPKKGNGRPVLEHMAAGDDQSEARQMMMLKRLRKGQPSETLYGKNS